MARTIKILAAFAAVASLAACDQTNPKDKDSASLAKPSPPILQYGAALAKKANVLFGDTIQSRAGKAGDKAADHARNALVSDTYKQAVGDTECTQDCGGHDAGFALARSQKIEDPENCPKDRGDAFEEGCRAYGETIQDARDDARGAVLNGKDPPS
jgi:hypothetical protein